MNLRKMVFNVKSGQNLKRNVNYMTNRYLNDDNTKNTLISYDLMTAILGIYRFMMTDFSLSFRVFLSSEDDIDICVITTL